MKGCGRGEREKETAQRKGRQNGCAKSQKKVELLDLFRKGQSRTDIEISF